MTTRPDITPLIGRELVSPPMPWNYVERFGATHEIFEQAAHERVEGHHQDNPDFAQAAVQYSKWARNIFLMPGAIAKTWRTALWNQTANDGSTAQLTTTETTESYYEMLERFETEHLGLEQRLGGTRWWVSNSGFSGGNYPTEAIASVMNMTSEGLLGYIRQNNKSTGFVLARSDVYVFAVADHKQNDEIVILDGIDELTDTGKNFMDNLLIAFAAGMEYAKQEPKPDQPD